jgi:phospholipase C
VTHWQCADIRRKFLNTVIQHVFVLVLENRSFDHMLGFADIAGTDASSGQLTHINGIASTDLGLRALAHSLQANRISDIARKKGYQWPPPPPISVRDLLTADIYNGQSYRPKSPADYAMSVDPGHEFSDVLTQLCGPGAVYLSGGAYPPIDNAGFVASCAVTGGQADPGTIMACYSPNQLPVLNALAREFVVCDNWYASMPGPTWPNRFFGHAASSGGLDHSPSTADIVKWDTVDGFSFKNGTVFALLSRNNLKWRIYAGDDFPVVLGLKGIDIGDIHSYEDFAGDVGQSNYPVAYTYIEPSYDTLAGFKCGTSQHPLNDVTRGESLIKNLYEAIRSSPAWNKSLLIITWDEHGGFYDHAIPPAAVPPGDTPTDDDNNQFGFTFGQYGVRVPALVISPLIPRNLIDHRVYDHSSIPATLEACFGLNPLTQRDAHANNLTPLLSLSNPRGDAPTQLPAPAQSGVGGCDPVSFSVARARSQTLSAPAPVSRPQDSLNEGNIPGFLFSGLRSDVMLSAPDRRSAIISRFRALKTRADAQNYLDEVQQKKAARRGGVVQRP